MKIAIITFSDFNTNYGSMLQSFSLGNYLEKLGHDVVWIKYREFSKDVDTNKKMFENIKNMLKNFFLKVYAFYHKKDICKTIKNFEIYKDKYLKYTKLYTSEIELENMIEEYDCCICGSDQIWNLECLGGLRTPYFLEFVPHTKKKIAYAASMGNYHFQDFEKETIKNLLKRIDYISVREKENIKEVKILANKEVESVVDPVFLTSKEEWENIVEDSPITGEYAICYFVRRSSFGKKIVKLISKYYKIPIYNLSDNMIYINGTSSKYISSGPLEFLAILKGAKFAVGTSFHLTAFSIIFNIPFLSIGMETNRSRINNILELVDLEDRFITEKDDYEEKVKHICNFNPNFQKLNNYIEKSKLFLDNAL